MNNQECYAFNERCLNEHRQMYNINDYMELAMKARFENTDMSFVRDFIELIPKRGEFCIPHTLLSKFARIVKRFLHKSKPIASQ